MVNYETLPNAIVPVAAEHFHARLTPEEEYYALQVSQLSRRGLIPASASL